MLKTELTARDGHDAGAYLASSANIGRRIANKTYTSVPADLRDNMFQRFTKYSGAALAPIAEEPEREKIAQAGGFNLVPADGLKIS